MRNWTIKEAVEVVNAGTDQEAIKEIAKHFPLAFMAIAKNDLAALAEGMNEKFTMRRLVFGNTATAETEDDVDVAETTEAAGGKDLDSMTTKQLMQLCDKRGIKVPHYGKNKQFYLEQLQGAGSEEAAEEEAVEDGGDEVGDYDGKSAMELFKLCKERGIKAVPKKPAKFYVGLLEKADAAEAEEATEDGEEDWGDDEEEEAPAPKAKAKPAAKGKPAAKAAPAKGKAKPAAKAAAEADDEEDDWDI